MGGENHTRVSRTLTICAGVVLVAATFVVNAGIPGAGTPAYITVTLIVSGCTLTVMAIFARSDRALSALAKMSLVIVSATSTIGLAESAFRLARFDFDALPEECPIFNRPASYPIGGGILRRPGPAVWRGKPLSSLIHYVWGNEQAYPNEETIEVRYDRFGFRNPPDLTDWEVVVTGDSFVESGYLPVANMFTTIAAQQLGIRIKNLGVSGTGTISQTEYLKRYGKAASTRDAVLCFFDGNDVSDIIYEKQTTNYIAQTGHRIGGEKQVSLIAATCGALKKLREKRGPHRHPRLVSDAVLVAGTNEIPAAIWPFPPQRWSDVTMENRKLVAAAIANWGKTVRTLGMRPWLMCIPDSRRVLQDHLRYKDTNSPMARWQPTLLGPHLEKVCASNDIRYIDTYAALRRELEAGRAPYNVFGDVHLTADGSRAVAGVLAEALKRRPAEKRAEPGSRE